MKNTKQNIIVFPPEWYPQDRIEMAWPDVHTDWVDILQEVRECYVEIAKHIMKQVPLLLLCTNKEEVLLYFEDTDTHNLLLVELPYNDTWVRDYGGITVFKDGKPQIYDFTFNGWGLKFASSKDNYTNRLLKERGIFGETSLINKKNTVLEGGSIEVDGAGTLMTTTSCLLSPYRNAENSKDQLNELLKNSFGVSNIIWLSQGAIVGDDTDGHIDTLARFAPNNCIVYCKSYDMSDEHCNDLMKMEREIKMARNAMGKKYNLCPVPLPSAVFDGEDRLPATYVNYLILNEKVLVPIYGVQEDSVALEAIGDAYPGYKIVGINCVSLVKQHGSLHCVTMNYPKGVF